MGTPAVGGTRRPIATLTVNGVNDLTVKSLDTSDADITTLTVHHRAIPAR